MKKLLLIGSDSIHTFNYYLLVKDFFDEVTVITDSKKKPYDCPRVIVDFSLRNFITALKSEKTIKKTIKTFKPSVIHIHQANSTAFIALMASKKFRIPKILTAWGSDILLTPQRGVLYKRMVKYNLKYANHITCDSEDLIKKMQELVLQKKLNITVANFGIDIGEIPNLANKENIIYSNRLHNKLYRIDKIIIAFHKFLKDKKESWKLVIAGEGEETENLKQLVKSLNINNNVAFEGWVDKIKNYEYYKKAWFFVSIPESDATSISLLEAMSNGCIPVLSNINANNEWVTNGQNGILINNIDDNFLEQALTINAEYCSTYNFNLVQQKASKESQKKIFVSIYQSLID